MARPAYPRTLYRIDSTKVSAREYSWGTQFPLLPIALLLKVLRIRVPGASDDPNVEWLAAFEVDALPEEAAARLQPQVDALEAEGFQAPLRHRIEDDLHQVETNLVSLVHASGRAWARVHERRWKIHTPPKEVLFTEIVTPLAGGRFLWSLSSKADLAAPPSCIVVRRLGASPAELWRAHEEALRTHGGGAAAPLSTADDLRAAVEAHHRAVRNFHLRRGVFAPLTPAQKLSLAANEASRLTAAADGSRHPDVLAEIRRLQSKRSSATTALLVLAVSLGLFVATAGTGGLAGLTSGASLKTLLIILGVLVFHESGHWVAMRVFGYRNVQMLFIPFLGAAVMGQHYNVPGWKKAVVSLMGPLPGIAVGSVLGVAGLMTQNALLLEIALIALALNAFNLLPVLPLDGGWVVQAVVGSRHAALDVLMRVLAVTALVVIAATTGDRVLTFVAIALALGIPLAYRIARTTTELRREGLAPVSTDEQTIPAPTAEAIIGRLIARSPKQPTKQLAQATLSVFEALNARPPGLLASLALGTAQVGAFVLAAVVASVVFIGRHTSLGSFIEAAATMPQQKASPGEVAVLRPLPAAVPHNTIIATFPDAGAAGTAARDVAARAPALPVGLFGQSALVGVPAADDEARKSWLADLGGRAKDVFVATGESPARVRVACVARDADAAAAIEQEAGDYLAAVRFGLSAPWGGEAADPRHARARRTYKRVSAYTLSEAGQKRMAALREELMAARKAGDAAASDRAMREITRVGQDERRQAIAAMRGEADVDAAVVDAYLALLDDPEGLKPARLSAAIGPLLGQVADPAGPAARRAATMGYVSREGLLVQFPFLVFRDSFEGPLAAGRWLQEKGCSDLQYEFGVGGSDLLDELEELEED